jgi:hypothetical protein
MRKTISLFVGGSERGFVTGGHRFLQGRMSGASAPSKGDETRRPPRLDPEGRNCDESARPKSEPSRDQLLDLDRVFLSNTAVSSALIVHLNPFEDIP